MADPADTAEGTGETSKPAAAAGGFTMPVFGGGAAGFAAFSAGAGGFVAPAGGFAPFGGAAPAAAAAGAGAAAGGEEGEEEGAGGDPEAECAAVFKPLVTLDEVVASTGEEEEAALFEAKAKSYRFADEWREKGTGVLKLLQHNDTRKVRLLMRRDKTLKICANFLVLPGVKLAEHSGSDKSCVFTTRDFSDESSGKQELFCLRFASVDKLKAFWAAWEGAQAANEALGVGKEPAAGGGDKAAEAEPTATAAATAGGAGQPRAGGAASDATAETGAAVSKPGGGAAEEEGEEVSSKAGDALAASLAAAKIAPPP